MSKLDDTRIDEDLLHACASALFGAEGALTLMRVYNAMDNLVQQEIENAAEDAWHDGHAAGVKDGKEAVRFNEEFMKAAAEIDEKEMADEAQLTMDAMWGGGCSPIFTR